MNKNGESVLEIEDLCLVSYLAVSGFAIETINPKNYPQCSFLFKKTMDLESAIENFYNNSASVEPKSYWAKIRELKSRIKSIKN